MLKEIERNELKLKELTLADKELFDKYFKRYQPQISELSFTNLFIWRGHYRIKYTEINGYLCIISFRNDGVFMFPPIGEKNYAALKEVILLLDKYFKDNDIKFLMRKVHEEEVPLILEILGQGYIEEYDRDNSDYVYLTSNLITLSGNKYHKKRNHINKFVSQYKYEYRNIDKNNKNICYKILEKWLQNKKENMNSYKDEILAINEIIENYEDLQCTGGLIIVDGLAEGFTFGELLNDDTAVIHIEKINSKINGLGEFINQEFCKQNFKNTTYINREQDLGIEGIRKAKQSYHPEKLINKYNIIKR